MLDLQLFRNRRFSAASCSSRISTAGDQSTLIVLYALPGAPATVRWLTDEEKGWIHGELARDAELIGDVAVAGMELTLRNALEP